jgi:glycosyltransferase involved in cell wall biosynthesis
LELSVITIIMDEEEIVDRWLHHHESLFKQVDVVIVDGGSEDNTVEKIRNKNIEPYFRKWDHDFSAQRNFAIEQAKYDWCLTLDVDLFLSKWFIEALPDIVRSSNTPVLMSYRYNYIDGEIFKPQFEEIHFRMFKKSCGARYHGKIHEGLRVPSNIPIRILDKKFYAIHDKSLSRAKKRWKYYKEQFNSNDLEWLNKM